MKKFSVRLIRKNINFDKVNLDNVECSAKNFFWFCMTFLFGVCSIVVMALLAKEMLQTIQGIVAFVFINLIFIVPFIYCLLKVKNCYFSIKNNKMLYKNILGITYESEIKEIKDIKWMKMGKGLEFLIIKIENKKSIMVSNYLTNFDLLKLKFQKLGKL